MYTGNHLNGRASGSPLSFTGLPDRSPALPEKTSSYFECAGVFAAQGIASGVAVALSGRLDDLERLRAELALPGVTDAAMLVREAYRKWGPRDYAAHLYGDFAVVLWDSAAKRLVLTRSPSGLYPLFYTQLEEELHFSSNPQTVLRSASIPATPDEQALAEWLVLRPCLSDRTLFSEVRRVPPGSSVLFERGRLSLFRHWRPESLGTLPLRDHREYADALREALQLAVSDRLRGTEGDVAAQLSGGLDSSSVTAFAAQFLAPAGRRVLAFTAVPGALSQEPVSNRFFDESSHAAAVAERYSNVVHSRVATGQSSLFTVLDRYTDAEAGAPFNPHHLLWIDGTYAAAARAGADTLLTGGMGNTTISASGNFALVDALQHGRLAQAARLFAADRASGARKLRHLPGVLLTAAAPNVFRVIDHFRPLHLNAAEFTGMRPEFAITNGIDLARWDSRLPFRTAHEHALDSIDRFDLGMFHESPRRLYGLNSTDPTFDRRVVELTLSIPLEQFCAGGVPRALIRTAMKDYLPDVVRLERRRGLQSADFLAMLDRERTSIAEELVRMNQIDLLRRALDIPLLQDRLRWSAQQAIASGWHQYSNRLMRAVSIGRFIRRMMEGTLFATLPQLPRDASSSSRMRL